MKGRFRMLLVAMLTLAAAPALGQGGGMASSLGQDVVARCEWLAASRWETAYPMATHELEDFDAAKVVSACEPALSQKASNYTIKAWLGHAYYHLGENDKGLKLLEEAAAENVAVAQLVLGDILLAESEIGTADNTRGTELVAAAADGGFAPAAAGLGKRYHYADRVPEDFNKAFIYYDEAARLGHPDGLYGLAQLYDSGAGVPGDLAKSAEYFRRAADLGHVAAQADLGFAYMEGRGVGQDYAEAVQWLAKAAGSDSIFAISNLGYLYENGLGVTQSYEQAAGYYQRAADMGDAYSQAGLGYLYENGYGVTQSYEQAAQLYEASASQGHAYAQAGLGYLYETGQGVAQDYVRAADLYQQAADQGSAYAQHNLGRLFETGQGVTQDYARALELYLLAEGQGNTDAAVALGYFYLDGLGANADPSMALYYSQKGADAGIADAQNRVGYIYAEGIGVQRDSPLALDWFRKAADQGLEIAVQNVAELEAEQRCYEAAASPFELPEFAVIGRDFGAIDADVAINACQQAVELDPASAEDKAWLARAMLRAGRVGEARPLLELAAAGGSNLGRQLLADIMLGDFGNTAVDPRRAMELLQPAAEAGFAPAQLSLGYIYDRGLGVAVDARTAVSWYQQAEAQGLDASDPVLAAFDAVRRPVHEGPQRAGARG